MKISQNRFNYHQFNPALSENKYYFSFISDLKRRRGGRGGAPPLRGRRHHRRRPPRSRGFGVHPDRRRISTLSTDFRFSFLSWILVYDFVILRIQKQASGLHVSSKFKNLLGRVYRIIKTCR